MGITERSSDILWTRLCVQLQEHPRLVSQEIRMLSLCVQYAQMTDISGFIRDVPLQYDRVGTLPYITTTVQEV